MKHCCKLYIISREDLFLCGSEWDFSFLLSRRGRTGLGHSGGVSSGRDGQSSLWFLTGRLSYNQDLSNGNSVSLFLYPSLLSLDHTVLVLSTWHINHEMIEIYKWMQVLYAEEYHLPVILLQLCPHTVCLALALRAHHVAGKSNYL